MLDAIETAVDHNALETADGGERPRSRRDAVHARVRRVAAIEARF